MMLILGLIVDFNDDESDMSDSECDSDNDMDLQIISSFRPLLHTNFGNVYLKISLMALKLNN